MSKYNKKAVYRLIIFLIVTMFLAIGIFIGSLFAKANTVLTGTQYKALDNKKQTAYKLAINKQDIFERINCYCGCSSFHESLKQCFIKEIRNKIVLDKHGSECRLCIREAFEVKRLQSKGYSAKMISKKIDQKFSTIR